uniref:Reverse transcriptase domain-containing protein n=1 Tax=Fagus sylvatica TaxID=28930 RepID=A0A2N9FC86_FAGSY
MAKIAVDYFRDIFSSSNPEVEAINKCLDGLERVVSPDMNDLLLEDFKAEEVAQALKQMYPTKAPGPDGMSAIFYQTYWEVVGPEILANRLKRVLHYVISKSQSAFVPGRLITDNVLVAFEIMHSMSLKRKGKKGQMALKLDMSKAYDRVEWAFLEGIMRHMGFAEEWIRKAAQGSLSSSGKLEDRLITGVAASRGGPNLTHLFFADDSLLFCQATVANCETIIKILQQYEEAIICLVMKHLYGQSNVETWLVLAWHLGMANRNWVVHDGLEPNPQGVVRKARSCSKLLKMLAPRLLMDALPKAGQMKASEGNWRFLNISLPKWEIFKHKPSQVWYVGALIRNHEGHFMAAMCSRVMRLPKAINPCIGACFQTLQFTLEAGFSDVIFEGPQLSFLDVVSMSQMEASLENMWAEDVWGLVQEFRHFTVSPGMVGANRAELVLAQSGCSYLSSRVWLEVPPVEIMCFL